MVASLLAAGAVACWFIYPSTRLYDPSFSRSGQAEVEAYASAQRFILLGALALATISATRAAVAGFLARAAQPTPSARQWTAFAIAVFSPLILYGLAAAQGRYLHPLWPDEKMHRLQTAFLSHFKFCLPAHPVGEFFEVPYVFVRPVTAPVYFPGTSLLHVPAMWLHLPYVAMPLLIAGLTLALLYLVVTELIDGAAGLLAVVLMISLSTFRWLALVEMSHAAGLMWGLAAFWGWLCWRRSRHARWAVLAGVTAGWYAITRPLDAACILGPLALAWAWELRRVSWRARWATVALAIAAAAPLLAVQFAFDRAVTGNALMPPLEQYYRQYFNTSSLGLQHYDPAFRPPTISPQIQNLYEKQEDQAVREFSAAESAIRQWRKVRLPVMLAAALPTLMLIVLLPAAIAGLTDRRRWALGAALCCYPLGSGAFYAFHSHYSAAIAPAMIVMVLLGANTVARTWPQQGVMAVFLWLAIFGLAAQSLWRNEQRVHEGPGAQLAKANESAIAANVRAPAIVICSFNPGPVPIEDPAYNLETPWPDNAPIIRAHDFGMSRNRELFRYYARTDPTRNVYLFNESDLSVRPLGNVKKLAGD
ncbi:MAG: hypothetical protein JWN51_3276 [Phycisphaerales bacterium]|nr:hypothetical protein [Phycisphaerales bacterium]